MNRYLKAFSAISTAVLLVGGFSTFASAAIPHKGKTETITGKVTTAGGLITKNGTPYLLYGYRAAGLRKYANETVTIKGLETHRGKNKVLDVQSFKVEGTTHIAKAEQTRPKHATPAMTSGSRTLNAPAGVQPPSKTPQTSQKPGNAPATAQPPSTGQRK